MANLNNQVVSASKWSGITEIMSKIVAPITHMALARILAPDAFGVVVTIQMVISFAEVFADAGFQKYIQQHKFESEKKQDECINVAFWTNLFISILIWGIIILFRDPIAALVGNPDLGIGLSVACVCIPLASFSSIQMSVFKRNLDFKTLFLRRVVSLAVPFVITIPLALWLRNYWALVIGSIAINLSNAVLLTIKSPWKPRLFYKFSYLIEMFSFCGWMLIDSILVWMTGYLDVFLLGSKLGSHYLGLYKASMTTVAQFTSIVTAAVLPVMLPALSKVQDDIPQLRQMLLKFQKYCSVLLLPLGTGIWLYSDLITEILLGDQWVEAAPFIGLWGLMEVTVVIFSRFSTVVYPAIGKPKFSVLAQCQYLAVFIPAIVIAVNYDFHTLYLVRSFVRLEGPIFNLILCYILIKQSPLKMVLNIAPEILGCLLMIIVSWGLQMIGNSYLLQFVSMCICGISYLVLLVIIPQERVTLIAMKSMFFGKIFKKK